MRNSRPTPGVREIRLERLTAGRTPSGNRGIARPTLMILGFTILLFNSACLLRMIHKGKPKAAARQFPTSQISLAVLPLNVPPDNKELAWTSLASSILIAKECEDAQDIKVMALWETLPVAIESLKESRNLTEDIAVLVASRVSAKWATQGEITPSKDGIKILIDFLPVRGSQIAYRYEKECSLDSMLGNYREAIDQFLRYQVAHPLKSASKGTIDTARLREIAQALDREYGWFTTADPGKADKTFLSVAQSDDRLARLLFNPTLYIVKPANPTGATPSPGAPVPMTPQPVTTASPAVQVN